MSLIHTPSKDATNKLRPVLADDEIEARIKVMADGCTKTLKGSDTNYAHYAALATALGDKQTQYLWYRSLSKCVSLISPERHQQLLASVWVFEWETDAYLLTTKFLIHLNSCHGSVFVHQTLKAFVKKFKDEQIQNPQSPCYETFHPLVHEGIRRTLAAVPGATSKLYALLSTEFPHPSASLPVQQAYVHNLLTVIEYCPRFRESIFHLLVDKIIQIDVSIKLEEVPDEETLFGRENTDKDGGGEVGWFGDCDLELAEDPLVKMHRENAEKLDVIIDLFLQYIISRNSEKERDEIFEVLIRVFDSLILSTYKSKYTQFILFYMCRIKDEYVERFLFFLCDKLVHGEACTLTLQSSVAYIGSFVGRATFIPVRITQEVLYRLLQWCHNYVRTFGDDAPDAGKHSLFYSICQSAMYIFCFKHEQLLQPADGLNFIKNLNFIHLLEANLNPLKLILTEVSSEFDKICRKMCGVPTITNLLKRNESIVLPTKAAWGGDNQLDTFFPFDPFLLRGSSKYFKGAYQFWQSSPEEEDEEEEHIRSSESRDRSPRRRRRNSDFAMSASYEDTPYGSFSTSMEMSTSWSKGALSMGYMMEEEEDVMSGAGQIGNGFLDAGIGLGLKGIGGGLYSF